jgi:hypothetical protein
MNVQELARYEIKYPIPVDRLDSVRDALRIHCALDGYSGTQPGGHYTIDTLYFDTPDQRFFRDGERRMPVRLKLRVRAYPDEPGSIVKIEVKRRVYDLILKTSTIVDREGWPRWLMGAPNLASLSPAAQRSLGEFLAVQDSLHARPRMLIRYRRQAFFSTSEDYVRITFDRCICYQPMRRFSFDAPANRWSPIDGAADLGLPRCVLMEVKFRNRPPVWVAEMVRRFGLLRQGYSKYNSATRRASQIAEESWDAVPLDPFGRTEEISWAN